MKNKIALHTGMGYIFLDKKQLKKYINQSPKTHHKLAYDKTYYYSIQNIHNRCNISCKNVCWKNTGRLL